MDILDLVHRFWEARDKGFKEFNWPRIKTLRYNYKLKILHWDQETNVPKVWIQLKMNKKNVKDNQLCNIGNTVYSKTYIRKSPMRIFFVLIPLQSRVQLTIINALIKLPSKVYGACILLLFLNPAKKWNPATTFSISNTAPHAYFIVKYFLTLYQLPNHLFNVQYVAKRTSRKEFRCNF